MERATAFRPAPLGHWPCESMEARKTITVPRRSFKDRGVAEIDARGNCESRSLPREWSRNVRDVGHRSDKGPEQFCKTSAPDHTGM
jgi:hypothetical protein